MVTEDGTWLGSEEIGLGDWRLLLGALRAHVEIGSFAAGARLATQIGGLVDDGSELEVELGHRRVRVALRGAGGGVTAREVALAEEISRLAAREGLVTRPDLVQVLEIALDTPEDDAVAPFWAAVLGDEGIPPLWFQESDSTASDRQRFHLDVTVAPEVAERRVAAAVAAGGRLVDTSRSPAFVVLADPDGNHVCVCTEMGRD